MSKKKILLLSDDFRLTSGIATIARELIIGTSDVYNWVNIGAAINHPENGKVIDMSEMVYAELKKYKDVKKDEIVTKLYSSKDYGDIYLLKNIIEIEKPDILLIFTDPRYWIWLFQHERELRKTIPLVYLNIWDALPYPMYNKAYYKSCDGLLAISKQTENINKVVLGNDGLDKIIRYLPHGINPRNFYPIENDIEFNKFKKDFMGDKEFEFLLFFNSRNIQRKQAPNLLLAWKKFMELIPQVDHKKCGLLLHTDFVDENGTDLPAIEEIIGSGDLNIFFNNQRFPVEHMNYLYNICDGTILISSNEGWGLSLTESLMCGKMVIANTTGGMQDQMRFEDENGEWIKFNESFGTNSIKKYEKCGEWALPVFPNNSSLVGSPITPYIFDDRVDINDVANKILELYNLPKDERKRRGLAGRNWVMSDESNMSSDNMCNSFISYSNEILNTFKHRSNYELIKTKGINRKLKYLGIEG